MKSPTQSQLELFSASKDYNQAKADVSHRHFLGYIKEYEKAILVIMGFMLTGVAAFSLGVEKGKKVAVATPSANLEIIQTPNTKTQPEREKQDAWQNYTIQVASYQSKQSAQREAEGLKKKGHLPLILAKGRYNIVCVGNFADKKMALALLSELKKRYQDCFVRRL